MTAKSAIIGLVIAVFLLAIAAFVSECQNSASYARIEPIEGQTAGVPEPQWTEETPSAPPLGVLGSTVGEGYPMSNTPHPIIFSATSSYYPGPFQETEKTQP